MQEIKEDKKTPESYIPSKQEQGYIEFIENRITILKDAKKNVVNGTNFEEIMKEADKEYSPKDVKGSDGVQTYVEREDELTGRRGSKLETIKGEDDWRSNISEPTLMIKIQTAMSILIDNNPEAVFKAMCEKYKGTEKLAQAIWKRNWMINNGKNVLKLFIFDLMKYGWAVGRTVPRKVSRTKEILDEIDTENPEKNKYRDVEIVDFNDVYKEVLDPHRVWIDDKANLKDPYSLNDWYFEKDFSKEDFEEGELKKFENGKYIKFGTLNNDNEKEIKRDDMITVGFYENKSKDLYIAYIPDQKILLYKSPLPNDEGKLTLWQTYWIMRDPRTVYGVGLYELIKANKTIYDRLKNMTIDQLTMAIYPMLFYTGAPNGEMALSINPSKIQQKQSGTTIDQIDVRFDPRGWEGVAQQANAIDDASGITQTLQGNQVEGKTLGEVLHAKDSALKRLNIPMSNIANAIEQEAYLTLSWANQVYSIPEIKQFTDGEELLVYERENNVQFDNVDLNEGGQVEGQLSREIELSLEEDREGNLIESKEARYFKIGSGELPLEKLKWEGRVSVKAMSIISPNPELERQVKLELFNLLFPVIQAMMQAKAMGDMDSVIAYYKPIKQILEIQDEKPENWIPKDIIDLAENPEALQAMKAEQEKAANPLMVDQSQIGEDGSVMPPEAPTGSTSPAVPNNETTNPLRKVLGGMKGAMNKGMSNWQR